MIILILHNKLSVCHHENLDLSSWKSRTSIIKSRPVIKKISTVYKEISTFIRNGIPYKITKVAWKFAMKWQKKVQKISGNYQ